jgi:hypothetical protein
VLVISRHIYTAPIVRHLAICSIVCMCDVTTALLKVQWCALHNQDAKQNTSRHFCYITDKTFITGGVCSFHFSLVMLDTPDQCIQSRSSCSMVLRFCNETKKTTLLPPADIRSANTTRADEAEKIVVSARGKRSTCARQRPHTLTEVEALIDDLVRLGEADGYHELLPGSGIYYCCGSTAKHIAMLNESAPMSASADSARLSCIQTLESEETAMSVEEGWRRFLRQCTAILVQATIIYSCNYFIFPYI